MTASIDPVDRYTLTVPEVAERLGISRASAYRAARAGEFPVIIIGRSLRVPRRAFEAWFDAAANGRHN